METKVCKSCNQELPIRMFLTRVPAVRGYLTSCKPCNREHINRRERERKALEESQRREAVLNAARMACSGGIYQLKMGA